MIITDDFVMLNFPKTGSSFARTAIRKIYKSNRSLSQRLLEKAGLAQPAFLELMLPHIDDGLVDVIDQHGTYRQIPDQYRDRKILSTIRNPFSRYLSGYHYRWWVKYPPIDIETLKKYYPHFPSLSFAEYYQLIQQFAPATRLHGITPKIELGIYSIQFIQFYFHDPDAVLRKIDDDYIECGSFKTDMADIHFLHQENLRQELATFLKSAGLRDAQLAPINGIEDINVSTKTDENFERDFVQTGIYDDIKKKDRLLFNIFPEYLT